MARKSHKRKRRRLRTPEDVRRIRVRKRQQKELEALDFGTTVDVFPVEGPQKKLPVKKGGD